MTTELIAELIRLDPATGKLYWRERQPHHFTETGRRSAQGCCNIWNARFAGKEAMTALQSNGYRVGDFMGKHVRAHRVVFLLAYGYLPKQVDHINGDRLDNRPQNLREATHSQNSANRKPQAGSTSKFLGVSWHKSKRKWQAQIRRNGKQRHLGYYETGEEAALAFNAAAVEAHGEYAKLNVIDDDRLEGAREEVAKL